ncbi:hypothetical protein T12_4590 [Trichinella patagoniensis]|uniref:Uncharacterized protein n=1 Tax=Trichinella patagoniensis TaxID=990121 RepID=A0A0V0ZSZ5_9BILA|nr:hypothetical protein T12_4590 [Trichinella patagoniensis]
MKRIRASRAGRLICVGAQQGSLFFVLLKLNKWKCLMIPVRIERKSFEVACTQRGAGSSCPCASGPRRRDAQIVCKFIQLMLYASQ